MENKKTKIGILIVFILVGISLGLHSTHQLKTVQGGAPPGLPVGTSSIETFISASTTAGFINNATQYCTSRVISTASTSIQLSFGSTTPSASRGHWQAASTTIMYDASLYGCGQWTVYGFQTGTISFTEFR